MKVNYNPTIGVPGHDGQALRGFLKQYGAKLQIKLDGRVLDHVVSFDTKAGTVRRLQTDQEGRIFAVGGEAAHEDLLGTVTLEVVDE